MVVVCSTVVDAVDGISGAVVVVVVAEVVCGATVEVVVGL